MSREPRKTSEANLYHAICRGSGRQIIFEDDEDRQTFLDLLVHDKQQAKGRILAWCLMDNHVHLLVEMELATLSRYMRSVLSKYAVYFNKKYARTGHLFQGRFSSEPINDDSYLLNVVRYIHLNPSKPGIACSEDYPWSSYGEYLGRQGVCDTGFVLDMLDGVRGFKELCADEMRGIPQLTEMGYIRVLPDEQAKMLAEGIAGVGDLGKLKGRPRDSRDKALALLLRNGFSIRQIERLTGISRGVIQNVGRRR